MTERRTLLVPIGGSLLTAAVLAWGLISCFVDPSPPGGGGGGGGGGIVDPATPVVQIDPAGAVLRLGHSQVFRATASGDGTDGASVVFDVSPAIQSSFAIEQAVGGDPSAIRLVGNLNLPGDYVLGAHVEAMEQVQGTALINTAVLSFGNPPPPFRIVGGGPGDALKGAVASGGGKSLVGFANQNLPPLTLGPSVTNQKLGKGGPIEPNNYIQRYDAATGALEVQIDGLFVNTLPNEQVPPANVAADCEGNAYWWDAEELFEFFFRPVLNRLPAGDTTGAGIQKFPLILEEEGGYDFTDILHIAVGGGPGCDGSLYFVGFNLGFSGSPFPIGYHLWRLRSFDGELERVQIGAEDLNATLIRSMAVDRQGRLVLSMRFGSLPEDQDVLRILPDAPSPGMVDPSWMPSDSLFQEFLGPVATDGEGLVYVVTDLNFDDCGSTENGDCETDDNRSTIHVLNENGTEVSTITNYSWCCPSCGDPPVCEPMDACATMPSFQNIQNLAAAGDGSMLIFDNVFQTGLEMEGSACPPGDPQDNARLILFTPSE